MRFVSHMGGDLCFAHVRFAHTRKTHRIIFLVLLCATITHTDCGSSFSAVDLLLCQKLLCAELLSIFDGTLKKSIVRAQQSEQSMKCSSEMALRQSSRRPH